MAIHRPPLFTDSDILTFRQTPVSEYRIPYTFVESLNEGTLFDRSARTFEEAARSQRLYDVVVGEDQRVIGAGMLQDTLKEADGHRREEELGALMVHPAARGIGISGLMIKLVLVHRYDVLRTSDSEEDYVAHVVDGNLGPIHALLAAGFEDLGPMKLHPGEFDGHIEHMMAPGENYVPMHAYRFNRDAIDNLIRDLWTFWHGGREFSRPDRNLRVKVDFSGMVDPAFLDTEVERIGQLRSPN
jgi:GNAT superfamily N-acetyltransferase